ncbi:hypothetical protein M2232_009241 [Bradyrhizobium japonicum]|nr:hypothetical protein [Bradyrhizobium japonicum]MCW2225709.1 hypothetical protein [Bradyrhizobium japonicum]MCW2340921.1 hypothetical protein [Bradyrhizobium japonicum]
MRLRIEHPTISHGDDVGIEAVRRRIEPQSIVRWELLNYHGRS